MIIRLRMLETMILTYLLEVRLPKAKRVEQVLRTDGYVLKNVEICFGTLQYTKHLRALLSKISQQHSSCQKSP